jgi:hypoxanthine phosphoribosyltransferase
MLRPAFTLMFMEMSLEPNHLYISSDLFDRTVKSIARAAAKTDYSFIVAPCRGGLIPGTVLSHLLNIPLYPLVWSTRDFTKRFSDKNMLPYDLTFAGVGQRVLLVEDIIDSGRTAKEIITEMKGSCDIAPESPFIIDIAAVVTNTAQTLVHVKYPGYTINKDEVDRWVDFWWEDKQ